MLLHVETVVGYMNNGTSRPVGLEGAVDAVEVVVVDDVAVTVCVLQHTKVVVVAESVLVAVLVAVAVWLT